MKVEAGGRTAALPSRECVELGVEAGAEIDWESLVEAAARLQAGPAGDDAARYLAASERTAKSLAAYLARRGYLPEVTASVVSRFVENGWVDDARFARLFAESRPDLGRAGLGRELVRRGVPAAVAAAMSKSRSDRESAGALVPLLRRRYGGLPKEAALRRALGFLARRGFSGAEAWRAAGEALGGGDEES